MHESKAQKSADYFRYCCYSYLTGINRSKATKFPELQVIVLLILG